MFAELLRSDYNIRLGLRMLLTIDDLNLILRLQFLIARAAQGDSLSWWDDESLTEAGYTVLERVFPQSPTKAGCKLALASAQARHSAIFNGPEKVLHLFQLDSDGAVSSALSKIDPLDVNVPTTPIAEIDGLRQALETLLDEPLLRPRLGEELSNRRREVALRPEVHARGPVELAKMLACAYLSGEPGKSIFPFMRVQ